MDKHTDPKFLQEAFEANKLLKPDYSLGNIKTYKDIPGWINDAEWVYERMVNEFNDGDEFLEIGTFFGQSTARMCELIRDSGKKIKFSSMDVYYEIESSLMLDRHPQSFKDFRNAHNYTDVYNLVNNIFDFMDLKKYVELICCDSNYGHRLFKDDSLQMVYVDGNHNYENVLNDLTNFFPKIKDGGYIVCDDTVYESVDKAIKDFCIKFNIGNKNLEYKGNCCIIKKGQIKEEINNNNEMTNENPFYVKVKDELNEVGCGMCLAKWTQVTLQLQSGQNHSCHHPGTHKISTEEIKRNPSALHNTRYKKMRRKEMLEGLRPSECDYCWGIEDSSNQFSDRIFKSGESWSYPFMNEIKNMDWRDDYNPKYVEVSFSNFCNFKCMYCGPAFSTSWTEEIRKHGAYPTLDNFNSLEQLESEGKKIYSINEENPYVKAFWEWWPELYRDLEIFRITGGEPLLAPDTWWILDHIIKEENPNRNLSLAINSNLGVSDKLIDKLIDKVNKITDENKVKEFIIFTSVDTWGDHAEYIRTGMVFNRFWDNVNKILTKCPRVNITFMSTYNALSIIKYNTLISEIYKLKEVYGSSDRYWNSATFLDTSYLRFPQHQSIRVLPSSFSENILEQSKLINYFATPSFDNRFIGYSDVEVQKVKRLYDWMVSPVDEYEVERLRYSFFKHFSEHDKRRNTDFCKTFPELEEFYNTCKKIELK